MKVRLALNGLLLGVLLVSQAEAGVIEISAYGNNSSYRHAALRNSSNDSVRTGRSEGSGNIFDGMLTKPVNLGSIRSRNSYGTNNIVYSGNSRVGSLPQSVIEAGVSAAASNRSVSAEASNRAISKILNDKQENRKEYNPQQPNENQPSPSPASSTATIPAVPVADHDQNSKHHEKSSSIASLVPVASRPQEYGTGRVKAYSYFYLSRTLWYVPLYFTLYFCFYILILVIRSIARHKVTYPNNFTGRSKAVQDMQFITNEQAVQKADMMTTFVMKQIEDFKEKYIG